MNRIPEYTALFSLLLMIMLFTPLAFSNECNTYSGIELCELSQEEINEKASSSSLRKANNNVQGIYQCNTGRLDLLDAIDLNTDEGKGVLVHELVHWLQCEMFLDLEVDDLKHLEPAAYRIEKKLLATLRTRHKRMKK